MRLNLLWPAWARLLVSRPVGSTSDPIRWRLIRRAARLMADGIEREQQSRAIPPWHRHIWVHRPELRETGCLLCWVRIPMRRFYKRTWVMALAVLALVVLTGEARAYQAEPVLFRALGWATLGASAGDLASTELALSAGGIEANPLQRSLGVRLVSHVAAPLVTNAASSSLYRRHPKTAWALRIASVALFGYATARNLRELRR